MLQCRAAHCMAPRALYRGRGYRHYQRSSLPPGHQATPHLREGGDNCETLSPVTTARIPTTRERIPSTRRGPATPSPAAPDNFRRGPYGNIAKDPSGPLWLRTGWKPCLSSYQGAYRSLRAQSPRDTSSPRKYSAQDNAWPWSQVRQVERRQP